MSILQGELKMRKIIVLLFIVLLLVEILPISSVPTESATTGWLSGWSYRRAVTINNTANSNALSNYQVLVTVDTASLISAKKLQSSCADIRFTDSDGQTLLNYWIDPNTCNTGSTRIYVKVPSIPASSTYTIYMYYGNSTATSASNGEATFILFDDFLGTSLNTTKWNVMASSSASVSISGSILQISEGSSSGGSYTIGSTSSIPLNSIIEARVYATGGSNVDSFMPAYTQANSGGAIDFDLAGTGTVTNGVYLSSGRSVTANWTLATRVSPVAAGLSYTDLYSGGYGTWYKTKLVVTQNSQQAYIFNDTWYRIASATLTSSLASGTYYVNLGATWSDTSGNLYTFKYDWVLVRSYTNPEPATSVSSTEETPTLPAPTLTAPGNGTSVFVPSTVNFTWTYNPAFTGDTQSAYQLQISNSSSFTTLFVDTGQVSSSNSYAIITLPSNMMAGTYYWRVKVWSSAGYSSSWSQPFTLIAYSLTVAVGTPVTLTSSFSIAPNDTIAPHLYTWYFDGVDDYVDCGNANSLNYFSNGLTLVAWGMQKRYTGTDSWLLDKDFTGYRIWGLDRLMLGVRSPSQDWTFLGSKTPALNTWYHVVGVEDNVNLKMNLYINGQLDGTTTLSQKYNFDYNSVSLKLGRHSTGSFWPGLIAQVLIYSRALSGSEVNNIYAYNIINASSLVLFLDPTFYNGTHFLDLSGYNNHGVGYNYVSRIQDSRQWLYQVQGLASDGLVHFRFFPVNTRIEVYNSANSLVTSFIITGTPNQANLIEDYAVNLPAGNYTIKAYTYLDDTINQNNGSTRYTYIARYSPSSSMRIMWNDQNAVTVDYQISSSSSFSVINYENVVNVTSNYYDIALPSTNNTWYLRVNLQHSDGSWDGWSNAISFRTDYLVLSATTTKTRTDLSTGITATYTATYTDGSSPLFFNLSTTAVLAQLGVYKQTNVWWKVDVYSGATSSSEPPGTGYTYLGTVYPMSTHSYFTDSLGYVPSNYNTAYIFDGVAQNGAPYWATSVGSPSTNFALVYQSMVYLPQTGNYTFQLINDDGARLYINGSLIIDGWSGPGTRSSTVSLNAGWYNITVKYYEYNGDIYLLLGVTLPNGTSVNPLVPAYGIQMAPPVSSYNATLPSTPLTLLNYVSSSTTATLSFGLGTAGQVNLTLQALDLGFGFTANKTIPLVWDQVVVNSFAPSKPRFTVGDSPSFNISAIYAYDGSPFQGSLTLNDTNTKTAVGAYGYAITAVSDPLYGLTGFTGNTTTSVIFDKLVLNSYSFVLNNNVLANGTRIDYSYPSVSLVATFSHAYDGLPLNPTYATTVQLAGLNASWNGTAWVVTISSPGTLATKNYQVATNVQSVLNVRFVDPSPIFKIIYDSVNSTYSADLASNTISIRSVYGSDGSPLPSGIACINDAGSQLCSSISNGIATMSFNRFLNGTVSFVNANDSALVFSDLVKPSTLVVKWVNSAGNISLAGTVNAYFINSTSLPGYFRILSELKGNVSVFVNTSLVPVFAKVNGVPASFSYTNGYVLLYGIGSQVEVYYSTPSSPSIMPGSAPIGASYEIGFANNNYLQNATFKLGVLINNSLVSPFVEINGTRTYGTGVSNLLFPMVTDLSWDCPDNHPTIYYRIMYMAGGNTVSYATSYEFNSVNYANPGTLYPYIYIPGSVAGVVDRYGSVVSELLKYLATGVAQETVLGGVMPGGLVEYIILNSPVTIQYNGTTVIPTQGGTAPITLTGFRGYTLSYSVAGMTVSNILVSTDPFTLNFPYGIALMVITDPSSRNVNIVQVSVPQQIVNYTWPTTSAPAFQTPNMPSFTFQPSLAFTWDSPTFIVLYGSMVAVAILASRITGSILRGIMMTAGAYGFVFIGIGAFTGNLQPVMLGLLAFIVAVAMEVARRNAG